MIGKFSLKIAKSSCRLIITHHALFDIENKKNPVFVFFLLKVIRNTYNWAYRTFAVSKGVFDFLKRIGVRNVEIMFNPIEKKRNVMLIMKMKTLLNWENMFYFWVVLLLLKI